MVVAAVAATRIAQTRGYWLAILIAFAALPVRGLLASGLITSWGIIPVQVLDGVGAGMLSVAVPGLVARILDGTGANRYSRGEGVVPCRSQTLLYEYYSRKTSQAAENAKKDDTAPTTCKAESTAAKPKTRKKQRLAPPASSAATEASHEIAAES